MTERPARQGDGLVFSPSSEEHSPLPGTPRDAAAIHSGNTALSADAEPIDYPEDEEGGEIEAAEESDIWAGDDKEVRLLVSASDALAAFLKRIRQFPLLKGYAVVSSLARRIEAGWYAEGLLALREITHPTPPAAGQEPLEVDVAAIRASLMAGLKARAKVLAESRDPQNNKRGKRPTFITRAAEAPTPDEKDTNEEEKSPPPVNVGKRRNLEFEPKTETPEGREMRIEQLIRRAAALTEDEVNDLRQVIAEGERAFQTFVTSNLRLVIRFAQRYRNTLPFLDLIQAGNVGLVRAVERYDYTTGQFSTYATWWIRAAITYEIAFTARTIHLPRTIEPKIRLTAQTRQKLEDQLGRQPTYEEIAATIAETIAADKVPDYSPKKVEEYLAYAGVQPISLELPRDSGYQTGRTLGDLITNEDEYTRNLYDSVLLRVAVSAALAAVKFRDERQKDVILRRYGLPPYTRPQTLPEIAIVYGVTPARIQQIEKDAKLRLTKTPRVLALSTTPPLPIRPTKEYKKKA